MIRLANSPPPHVPTMSHSMLDLFRMKDSSHTMHRPIPAPEPNPEPNPGPDAIFKSHANISPEDWDVLFGAIQARLEHCVGDALSRSSELPPHDRHTLTKAAVLDCVGAMKQLHAALTLERQQWQVFERHQQYQRHEH